MNKKTFLFIFLTLSIGIIFSGAAAAANNDNTTINITNQTVINTTTTGNNAQSNTINNTNPDPTVVSTGIDYPTIRDAVNNAAVGDTILLDPGTYTGPDNTNIELTQDLTIIGSTDSLNPSIINAGSLDNIFIIDPDITITLEYITFENGYNNTGGAIYNQGNLIIENCTFNDNQAINDGGAIYNDYIGTLTESGSTFTYNGAYYGGAIYNDGTVTESVATLSHNKANEGGAIYNDMDGTITDTSSIFTYNTAYNNGGAIYNNGALTETKGIFNSNYANIDGGAIYNDEDGTLTEKNGVFNYNIANGESGHGGAISNEGALTESNSNFAGNTAYYQGGAIYNDEDGTLTEKSSIFYDNTATSGGAMYNTNGASMINTNNTFNKNIAYDGGAIYNDNGATLIETKDTFNGNNATNGVGAIYNEGGAIYNDGDLNQKNCTFINNNAVDGGAIYNDKDGELKISNNSTFTGNNASNIGGAIYNGGTLTETNSTYNNNNATFDGGAIHNVGSMGETSGIYNNNTAYEGGAISNEGILTENKSTYNNNTATSGGAICNWNIFTETNGIYNNNTAKWYGGAICNVEYGTLNETSSTYSNNTAYHDGGAIYNDQFGTLTERNGTYNNNNATYGGAICNAEYGTFNETSSTYSNNTANSGGAIFNEGTFTETNGTYNNNNATDGGAIYNDEDGSLTETSSNYNNNNATDGGAIYNVWSLGETGGTYNNNTAYNGGAIYNVWSLGETSSTYNYNTAYNGGAIYNLNSFEFYSSIFNYNNATDGGAIYNDGNGYYFYYNTYNNNNATDGGAIYNDENGNIIDYYNTYNNNNATDGGAIYNTAYLYEYGGTFNYNNATDGGAIYNDENGNINDYYNAYNNNNATDGGAIYNIGYLSEYYSTFDSNTANNEGGAIYNNDNANVNWNRIVNNTAPIGTAIYNDDNGWIDATLNWWGTNTPNTNGNDIINNAGPGQCNYNPWMILSINASPTTIPCSGTSNINVDLLHDNHGNYHDPANGLVPYTGLVTFTTTLGTINNAYMSNGLATSTLNAGTIPGTAEVNGTVDSQTVNAYVNFIMDVTGVNPANGAINVPTDQAIVMTFNDPITAGSAYNTVTVTYDSIYAYFNKIISGNTLIIWPYTTYLSPTNNWFAGTTYTINIPANSINGLITPFTYSFTTVPPTVTSVNPSNGAINVPTSQVITLTFSDRLKGGSAYNNISLTHGSTTALISKNINGNILTLTPSSLLFAGTSYTINLPANALNGLTPFTSSFTTVPPTVTSVNPTVGAINVPTSQVITLTFSDPIEAGSAYSSISLTQGSTTASISKTISGNTLTIKPTSLLFAGTSYTINLPANSVNGLVTPFTSSFTTVPPTVTSVNPTVGAINVPTSQVITLTFSDPIEAGSAYSSISLTQGSTTASISKTISGNTLTIKPTSLLFAGTTYTINLPANSVNGLVTPFTSSFTTVPPTVTSVNPTVGAINVPTSQVITLTFSDPIEAGSAYSSISLTQGSTTAPISITIKGNTLTIKPTSLLFAGTTYTINLPANSVNGLVTPFTYSFTTVPPTVNSVNPTVGAINVPTSQVITLTFSDPIEAGSAYSSISLTQGSTTASISITINGKTLTIKPTSLLFAGTTYTINLPANALNGLTPFTSSFTTVPPTVTSVNPSNGAINVPTNQVITLTFSNPIEAGSAYNNINVTQGSTTASISITISGKTLTITPANGWLPGTTYTINLPANAVNGLTTPYTSTFKTK